MQSYQNGKANSITSGIVWRLLERFGVQGIQFVLQLILARILSPEHYGVLSMMIVFTALANVFIQNGFNTSLIQNKDVTEEDYSSVFWVSLGIAAIMYGIIFVSAPLIAAFYNMPDVISPLRVLAMVLFPGTVNSIQLAKVTREMDFKKVFYSNVAGILVAGIAGVIIAVMGGGLWALVVQNILNISAACIVMLFTVKWYPRLVCNLHRVAVLFRFGWKLLIASLMGTLEQNLHSLVIGKKYDSGTLGFYNRGLQFPQFVMNAIIGAVQSVLLPAMSANQDDKEKANLLLKNSITMSSYIIFPMMAGLASVATPLIRLLLTDKWLPVVPYMQINCFVFAFYTVHVCNLQAINAMGRSDWFLKLEIIKKLYDFAFLAIAVFFFDSPIAIAMTGVVSTGISWYVNAFPNKKLIGYSFKEQVADLMPMFFMAFFMCGCVLLTGYYCENTVFSDIIILVIQFVAGVAVYLLLSILIKPEPFRIFINTIKYYKKNH